MSAICEHCFGVVPSVVTEADDGVWMTKTCPTHGTSRHCIEPDVAFYRMARIDEADPAKRAKWVNQCASTGLDVTRRCNVRCPHCYVEPDNKAKDAPLAEIVELAKHATRAHSIILMGAEPTVRADLPELIAAVKAATGKSIGIYTNAVRMDDASYPAALRAAGLDYCCISLHTPGYLGPKLFGRKLTGITNIIRAGLPIHHVSFSLTSLDELPGVIAHARKLRRYAGHIRIRSPQKVGICNDEPIALSVLYAEARRLLEAAGHTVEVEPSDNTPYHVNLRVNGAQVIRLIRWPTLTSAELSYLDCPPYALFDKEAGEVNLVLSFLLQEARRHRAVPLTQKTTFKVRTA